MHLFKNKEITVHELNELRELDKNIQILDSVGYFDILELMKNCNFIVTDSGGIQEEATSPSIRKKVVILRKTTDRPETVISGFSDISGMSYHGILSSIINAAKNPKVPNKKSPYGEGNSAKIIVDHLKKNL